MFLVPNQSLLLIKLDRASSMTVVIDITWMTRSEQQHDSPRSDVRFVHGTNERLTELQQVYVICTVHLMSPSKRSGYHYPLYRHVTYMHSNSNNTSNYHVKIRSIGITNY